MTKRFLVAALVTGLIGWLCAPVQAKEHAYDAGSVSGYAGIEFFGSSQVTRLELEKELALKKGSDLEATLKASRRLQDKLEKRHHLEANIEVATEGQQFYVAVDIIEPGVIATPSRKLLSPHRVYLTNELPLSIFDQLHTRLAQLEDEGRPVTSSLPEGVKVFSDESCNQLADKLVKLVPPLRSQLLEMVTSDPDPWRRSKAVEILNWDNRPVPDCLLLIQALEDSALVVRASADRYILPRVRLLPDNFPIQDLIEALTHQLCRPSHTDRTMALAGLLEIARRQPLTTGAIKVANEERLKQLLAQSLLSSVKQPARQLLDAFNHLPEPPKPTGPVHINEF